MLFCSSLVASDPNKPARFKRLTANDNLSAAVINTVRVTRQDPLGFIWFGSEIGLARYDGHEFRVYQHDPMDPNSLTSNVIWDIAFDHSGVMWLATDTGLGRYNSASDDFTNFRSLGFNMNSFPSDSIRVLKVDKHNNLLIATEAGFSILDPSRENFRSFTDLEDDPHRLPGSTFQALLVEDNGDIWLGSVAAGLLRLRLDPFSVEVFPHEVDNHRITSIIRDHTGVLWVSTFGGGVSRVNEVEKTFSNYPYSPDDPTGIPSATVWSIFEDSYNNLWVATDHGGLALYNRNEDNFSSFRHSSADEYSISSDQIRSLYEDRDGDLWISTFADGVNFFDRSNTQFENYTHIPQDESTLTHSTILTIRESRQGHLWIGTEGGINAFDPESRKNRRIEAKPGVAGALQSNSILSIAEQENGDLWVGTWSGGLHLMDHKTETFKHFPDTGNGISVNSGYIWSLLIDSSNNLWIGTETGGLNRYDSETQQFEYFPASIPVTPRTVTNVLVWALIEDHEGYIWAGSAHGLNRYDPEKEEFSHYFKDPENPQSICSNRILKLYEDSNDNIWLGTQGDGICILDPAREKFTHFTTQDGLPSDNVASIIEDQTGNIWAVTDNGAALLTLEEGVKKAYRKIHGLAGNIFNRDATYLHDNGELYLGSTSGLSIFNPEISREGKSTPDVTLTDFRIFNEKVTSKLRDSPLQKDIAETREIELAYSQRFFSVSFSTLNYRSARYDNYAYRLVGFDKNWNYVSNRNEANYTNISPGRYTLQIRAAGDNGVWSEHLTELHIRVLPPFWRTLWAYAFYLIVALFILWAIYNYKAKRIEIENERKVINKLVQIDKMKDAILANTSHELRTPLNGIIGLAESLRDSAESSLDGEQIYHLDMIVASGRRLSHLVNDILDMSKLAEQNIVLNKQQLDLHAQIELVISLLAPLTMSKSLRLINDVPEDQVIVLADQNRLQQILLNLIGNAVKYSDEGYVKISAKQFPRETSITIEDTGIGIDPEHISEIFDSFYQVEDSDSREHGGTGLGLSITKQLVELHKGELSASSNPGEGTRVSFTIPRTPVENNAETLSQFEPRQKPNAEHLEDQTGLKNTVSEAKIPRSKLKDKELLKEVQAKISVNKSEVLPPENASSLTILVVDDDPVNRMVLDGMLRQHNYKLLEADDGEKAVKKVEEHPEIDLIVMDVMMPKMTGYEACKIIRKTHPIHALPIIFLTAKDLESELTQGFRCGGNDFVIKPVRKEEFLARIKAKLLSVKKGLTAKENLAS